MDKSSETRYQPSTAYYQQLDEQPLVQLEVAVQQEWQVGDVILDLYEITALLGEGGMGKVYRAHHRGWNLDLAVKCPKASVFASAKGKEDYVREAETWVNLGLHPHLTTCYYVRTLGGVPRLFAECVEGGSLESWIEDGRLYEGGKEQAMERILDIAIQFAWGLGYAHEQGLVHQDVKPHNVLMTPDGFAKVTDFGLAKARAAAGESTTVKGSPLVSAGGFTPAYCSPEQAGRRKLDHHTDIWSWGVSVLEMFTGGVTWQIPGQYAATVLEEYLQSSKMETDVPAMPPALAELLRCCFADDPADRPQDMDEVAGALQSLYRQAAGEPYPRQQTKAAELRASSLNNKALSLLELGREQEAAAIWEQALLADPYHTEATYNLGLWRRSAGLQTDGEWLKQLDQMANRQADAWLTHYLLGTASLEHRDLAAARTALERAAQLAPEAHEVQAALRRLDQVAPVTCLRTLQGYSPLAMTADGRRALMRGQDNLLRLVDLDSGECLFRLEGYESFRDAVMTPDGRLAVSGGGDQIVHVWDLRSGRRLLTFPGHEAAVNCVAVTSDGCLAVSGSEDKTVRVWDLANRRCLWTFGSPLNWAPEFQMPALIPPNLNLGSKRHRRTTAEKKEEGHIPSQAREERPPNVEGHTAAVQGIALAEGKMWALSGSSDGGVRVWDLVSGTCLKSLSVEALDEEYPVNVYAVAVTGNGRLAVTCGFNTNVEVWDLRSGTRVRTLGESVGSGRSEGITSVAVSRDGTWAITGSFGKTVRAWNLANGACLDPFKGHAETVQAVAVSADGSRVISADSGHAVRVWQVPKELPAEAWSVSRPSTSRELQITEGMARNRLAAARSALASGQPPQAASALQQVLSVPSFERDTEALELWHSTGRQVGRPTGLRLVPRLLCTWESGDTFKRGSFIKALAVAVNSRVALSGDISGSVRLWDISTGTCLRTVEMKETAIAVAISGDGRFALAAGEWEGVPVWDLSTGLRLHNLKGHGEGRAHAVAITPDGRYAFTGGNGTFIVWDLSDGRRLSTCKYSKDVRKVSITQDGHRALLSTGVSQVWDLFNGKCLSHWEVEFLAITPDGRQAFSADKQGTIKVWDLESRKVVQSLEGHTKQVESIAITPDGGWAVSVGYLEPRVWHLPSGTCQHVLEEGGAPLAITPDGRYLLSSGGDTIQQWILDWDYEFPPAADWDDGAKPYLESFLALHTDLWRGLFRNPKPEWGEEDFKKLLTELGIRGYGWLKPEGVRRRLEELANED